MKKQLADLESPDLLDAAKETLNWIREFVGEETWSEIRGETHENKSVPSIEKLIQAIILNEVKK